MATDAAHHEIGLSMWKCYEPMIVDLSSPESSAATSTEASAPSTPTSKNTAETEFDFNVNELDEKLNKFRLVQQACELVHERPPPAHPRLQFLIHQLEPHQDTRILLRNNHWLANAIIQHLHNTPVKPSDVKLLVPALNRFHRIMNKMTTNIGLWHSKHCTSAAEVEEMLEHIFLCGDARHLTFQHTKNALERFRQESLMRKYGGPAVLERHQVREHECKERGAVTAEKQLRFRRKNFPQAWFDTADKEFLPEGAECVADVLSELFGFDMKDVRQQRKVEKWVEKERVCQKPVVPQVVLPSALTLAKWEAQKMLETEASPASARCPPAPPVEEVSKLTLNDEQIKKPILSGWRGVAVPRVFGKKHTTVYNSGC